MPTSFHNPFAHDVERAPLSTFDTFHTVLKSVFGIGTLYMPIAFACTGYLLGILLTIFVTFLYIYGIHLMLNCMAEASSRAGFEMTIAQTCAYITNSKVNGHFVNIVLILYHFAIAVMYLVFISESLKSVANILTESSGDIRAYIAVVAICIIPLFLIRDVQYLVPINIAGNILTWMLIVMFITRQYYIDGTAERGDVLAYRPDLFIGYVLFSISSVGVMVKIQSKMAEPEAYLGSKGLLNRATFLIVCTNLVFGIFCHTQTDNIDLVPFYRHQREFGLLHFQWMCAAVVFLSYPLNGYVAIDIIFNEYLNKESGLNNPIYAECILRIIFLLLSCVCALALPLMIPVVKGICGIGLVVLNLAYPAVLKLMLGYESRKILWMMFHMVIIIIAAIIAACIMVSICYDVNFYYYEGKSRNFKPFWLKPN